MDNVLTYNMDDEIYNELLKIRDLHSRRSYSHEQMKWIYTMYNSIFPKKKNITSCGKCNIQTLNALFRVLDKETERRNGAVN